MEIPRCPNCGFPVESSNYYLRGMAIKCRQCGHSGLPLSAGACIYDRLKIDKPAPQEPFSELEPRTVFPKLALLSIFTSAASAWAPDLRLFTAASFGGFLLFSALSLASRIRDGA